MSPIEAVGKKVSAISDGSKVISAGRAVSARTGEFVRKSYCYRWLTKEPDPEVIIIDLRETYAVGPFIALMDRLIPHIKDAWRHSKVGPVTRRVFERVASDVFDPLSETQGYELAVAVLTPPEPPEETRTGDDESESTKDNSS
ncbi:hypothetical protein [Haloarcula japonica]|uniref:Uncharacterized protein n=1 Tax=Haloarcula japonica (strain ATCC 49778 / DSM 6131 / JCM 7785 / NBRC 101032 / NCIMB 13157 / TR-1) TaxID=1227453 RepID=M0LL72_HALJT|nr:hypothetical protein C444_06046 [Haloarcula japonica DSM 6131]